MSRPGARHPSRRLGRSRRSRAVLALSLLLLGALALDHLRSPAANDPEARRVMGRHLGDLGTPFAILVLGMLVAFVVHELLPRRAVRRVRPRGEGIEVRLRPEAFVVSIVGVAAFVPVLVVGTRVLLLEDPHPLGVAMVVLALLLVATAAVSVRALPRRPTLLLTAAGVELHGPVRDVRLPWDDVALVAARQGPYVPALVLHLRPHLPRRDLVLPAIWFDEPDRLLVQLEKMVGAAPHEREALLGDRAVGLLDGSRPRD